MGENVYSFKRYEKKYVLSKKQYESILPGIEEKMQLDKYGLHTISNIYYDTDDYQMIRHSIEKPLYKEKFRVRGYGEVKDGGEIFAEIKKKFNGIVYKRRISGEFGKVESFVEGGAIYEGADKQIAGEIRWLLDYYKPSPKVFIGYDRMAYFGKEDEEFRLTFDHNVRFRENDLDLRFGSEGTIITDNIVMEVKVKDAVPMWLTSLLSEKEIYQSSFSKYGTYYQTNKIK